MSYFIPFLQEENLVGSTGLEMIFQDKHLVRYLTFAKHLLQKAINICQKDIAAGIFCLLMESDAHFVIWREQPSQRQKVQLEETPKLIETMVETPHTCYQSDALQHKSTPAVANTKTSNSKTKTFNIDSTTRSVFLALFNQELAQHIGPRADYLLNKLLAERPTICPQQMIQAIIAEIPDPKKSQNIQKSLERLTHNFTEMMQDHLIFNLSN